MSCRLVRSVAIAGVLLALLDGAVGHGYRSTIAQETAPPSHHGHHGPATPRPSQRSPYADDFVSDALIRSLTPEEVAQIERGEGAGFALPAELNGVPGPRHVLDLAEELALSDHQVTGVRAVADEMHAAVIPAGHRYLDALQSLEEDFRAGTLTESELTDRMAEVKRLEGELATAHLVAHLQTAELLTPDQIEVYARLRGYREATGP